MNLFSDIEPEEIKKMLACSKASRRELSAGEYVFQQGEHPQMIFLLEEGDVALVKDFASGRRNLLYHVSENEIFGESVLFSEMSHYWYDAVTMKPSTVLHIPWKFFYGFCEKACGHHQMITRNLITILAAKNCNMTKKLHLLGSTNLKEKIAIYLLENSHENAEVILSLNRENLADFIGTTRPSLSRELMNMQAEGLIEVSKDRIKIIDRDTLETLY